ncbi:MAG: dihydroorotase [Bacteroidetes bacterium]|nr:MAG: dihydroorotase [Bacteroidota bacterium]
MTTILIKNAQVINEWQIFEADILIKNGFIHKIAKDIQDITDHKIDATGKYVMAGIIDDQVHFREPGLTHKGTIRTEARAAVAGGTTTFMEMPNTVPNALNQSLLAQKYQIGAETSLANYSFFMGASNDNLEEVLKTDARNVCGIKIFMGSSTGNMLVDDPNALEKIFSQSPMLIATHCEDEQTVKNNLEIFKQQHGANPSSAIHPEIRDVQACLKSSGFAMELAKKHNTRLHILHISTAEEAFLFDNLTPLHEKRITSEVCVHHLHFDKSDYELLGTQIKCNPAIKESRHKEALLRALLADHLDIIATDHAPHTWEEKQQNYWNAPSGVPLVQHSLNLMLEFYHQDKISLEKIVEKMCHAPATCFQIEKRGFIREGYHADLVIFSLDRHTKVSKENLEYHCAWSPFENKTFKSAVTQTIVSGHLAYSEGKFDERKMGKRLFFERN